MNNIETEKLAEIKQMLIVISNKVAIPLFILFWLLDLIYVPHYKWEFLAIRSVILPAALILHWWLKHTNDIRQAEYAGLFFAFVCASILNTMIFMIGQGALYFIPLHLVAIGGLSFIPWNTRNFFIAVLLIYGPYLGFELYWMGQSDSIASFSVNVFFIMGVIITTWVIKSYRERIHAMELSMRMELESEIEKRKQTEHELIEARDNALAATRAKESFLANMSHEIRTPLTSIIGYADIGLDKEQTTKHRIDALKTIRRSGDHLLSLINDILDFSKIEAGELGAEKNQINPLQQVSEVESIISGHAAKKHLDLVVDYIFPLPKEITSDAIRIKQILLNLCNNAIKFTDKGEVKVTLKYELLENRLIFAVTDTGIGMNHEQMQKVFEPFKQADSSTTRRFGGTGLGLSLSRQLALILGGQLEVNSELGKGTTFTFSLDLGDQFNGEFFYNLGEVTFYNDSLHDDLVSESQLKGNILLAEDNAANQQLIKMYLEKMGADVTCADNGEQVVAQVQKHDFDLIYMDMQMPVMSGLDAVATLRRQGYNKPIVMLTANATYDDKSSCLDAGANDFVTKPIVRRQLYEVSARYLKPAANDASIKPVVSDLLQKDPSLEAVLVNYIESLKGMQEKITEFFNKNKIDELSHVIHDLKGTAGGYGYPDLTKLAKEIELSIQEKDRYKLGCLLENLQSMCSSIYLGFQQASGK